MKRTIYVAVMVFCIAFLLVHYVVVPTTLRLMPCDPLTNLLSTAEYMRCLMERL